MRQIKLFKGIENEVDSVEREINQWIRTSGAQVVSISGNIAPQTQKEPGGGLSRTAMAPSDVLLVVLYESDD